MNARTLILHGLLAAVAGTTSRADPPAELFVGGSFDGHAITRHIAYTPPADFYARYAGGGFDGHDVTHRIAYAALPDANVRYAGGPYDGNAFAERDTANLSLLVARFHGGSFDGGDVTLAGPYANPLDRDTDGDGIPDWWSVIFFHSLFGDAPGADLDADGWNTFQEYVADTDPSNPTSRFAIVSITATGKIPRVSFSSSSSNRLYTVEYSTNLTANIWSNVPSAPQRPGAGGPDAFTDTTNTNRANYRIRISFP